MFEGVITVAAVLRDIFMRRSRGENTTEVLFISFSSKSSTHVTRDVIRDGVDKFDDGVIILDGLIKDGGTNGEEGL